jgi:hypothetical protein
MDLAIAWRDHERDVRRPVRRCHQSAYQISESNATLGTKSDLECCELRRGCGAAGSDKMLYEYDESILSKRSHRSGDVSREKYSPAVGFGGREAEPVEKSASSKPSVVLVGPFA